MSFVTTDPEALTVAAASLQGIGSAMAAQNAAAAAPTTGLLPAAADEVSALQATQFAAYGTLYQQVSAAATALHDVFVHTLRTSADSYGATEAANSIAAAPSGAGLAGAGLAGLGGAGLAGAGLGGAGLTGGAAADPSFGLGGALSNSAILAAMQAGNVGSAASEFTGLGKGYISEPSGVIGPMRPFQATLIDTLVYEVTPAAATPVAAAPVAAGLGHGSSVGALSVPPSWAAETAPVAGPAAAAPMAGAGWATPAQHSTPVTALPAGVSAMAAADRARSGFGTPRYGVKPRVMPRPPVG